MPDAFTCKTPKNAHCEHKIALTDLTDNKSDRTQIIPSTLHVVHMFQCVICANVGLCVCAVCH